MSERDGVALQSTAHPTPRGFARLWSWLRALRGIRRSAIETTQITLTDPVEGNARNERACYHNIRRADCQYRFGMCCTDLVYFRSGEMTATLDAKLRGYRAVQAREKQRGATQAKETQRS